MCGGVIFPYRKEYKEVLEQYYSPADVAKFEETGEEQSAHAPSRPSSSSTRAAEGERVARLESEVEALRVEVAELRRQLEEFRKQFE